MSVFKSLPEAPPRRQEACHRHHHGITRTDDYAWLRADNWQQVFHDTSVLIPKFGATGGRERLYEGCDGRHEALHKQLFAEMKGPHQGGRLVVPMKDGPLPMAPSTSPRRTAALFPHPAEGGERQVILDGDKEAEGKEYLRLAVWRVRPTTRSASGAMTTRASKFFTLRVRNLTTGEDMSDLLENTGGGGAWDAEARASSIPFRRKPPPVQNLPSHPRPAAIGRPLV